MSFQESKHISKKPKHNSKKKERNKNKTFWETEVISGNQNEMQKKKKMKQKKKPDAFAKTQTSSTFQGFILRFIFLISLLQPPYETKYCSVIVQL